MADASDNECKAGRKAKGVLRFTNSAPQQREVVLDNTLNLKIKNVHAWWPNDSLPGLPKAGGPGKGRVAARPLHGKSLGRPSSEIGGSTLAVRARVHAFQARQHPMPRTLTLRVIGDETTSAVCLYPQSEGTRRHLDARFASPASCAPSRGMSDFAVSSTPSR